MTVFEDLIVELQEENLLEDTVLTHGVSAKSSAFVNGSEEHDFAELIDAEPLFDEVTPETGAAIVGADAAAPKRGSSSAAHKFAIEQVATFQMVEHVVTSIERSRLDRDTQGFDELRTKAALHKFRQASADPSSTAFPEAEAGLAHEVAVWQKNLAERDSDIPVPMMRQYCETCQPALSAQALFSLAQFYRSLPYSESSRGKFEFLVTRLFSRKSNGERRTVICTKEEMLGHLNSRFRDVSDSDVNIPDSISDTVPNAATFDNFKAEAEKARSFAELIEVNFFGRLYQSKEAAGKSFFTPTVTAAAIASNIAIGNKLADLLNNERLAKKNKEILEKYSSLYDEPISSALGRTIGIESLLSEPDADAAENGVEEQAEDSDTYREVIDLRRDAPTKAKPKKSSGKSMFGLAGVNRWLLVTTMVVIVLSVGLFLWANYFVDSPVGAQNVKSIDISSTQFKDIVKEARLSGETFYGITSPAWDNLTKESQQDVMTRLLKFGAEKGFKRVSLINGKGQTVGYAVDGRVEVYRL
jgi:hypothetical protein